MNLKSGSEVDFTDLIFSPVEHDGTVYLVFKDKSAIVRRGGKSTVEAEHPVAVAYEEGKAGAERCYPVGSAEALAYEDGTKSRIANSPEAKQRRADLFAGKITRYS